MARFKDSWEVNLRLTKRAMLDANGFTVAGGYFGQIVADTPAFHYQGREMLFKLTVPIRLD